MLNKVLLEEQLSQLPLFQYAFMKTSDLVFTERVRHICKEDCPRYGTTWACPPAVGSVDACKARCLAYPELLVVSTITEVNDIENMDDVLATRMDHEAVTGQVADLMKAQGLELRVLSTESCAICEECTYPNAPCRHPDRMFPCVESQGILVTDICEKLGIEFFNGNIATWFSLVLYR